MSNRLTHDQISQLKADFAHTKLSIGLIKTSDLLGLIAEIEHLQQANRKIRMAAHMVADNLRDGGPFDYEARLLLAALREEEIPGQAEPGPGCGG